MKSFALLRTNVALSTNWQLYITSKNLLYLESINSNADLNDSKYKKIFVNYDAFLSQKIPNMWNNTPEYISYYVNNEQSPQFVYNDYSQQYSDLYRCGGQYINNLSYTEEFEYFAPLHVGENFPNYFMIFRVDGHGKLDLNATNISKEIFKKLKFIKQWDLTETSDLGIFFRRNILDLPKSALEFSFKSLTFSKWCGWDYNNGGNVNKSIYADQLILGNKPFYRLEKQILDAYQNLGVIYPYIFNLTYLFDDTPATPSKLKKWSINRYYGFYIQNMELVNTYTPYQLGFQFTDNLSTVININGTDTIIYEYIIKNNQFLKLKRAVDNTIIIKNNEPVYIAESADPIKGGWKDELNSRYWFYYNNSWYKIIRQFVDNSYIYNISSEVNIIILNDVFNNMMLEYNKKLISFKYENSINRIYCGDKILKNIDIVSEFYQKQLDSLNVIWALTSSQTIEEWKDIIETSNIDPNFLYGTYYFNNSRIQNTVELYQIITRFYEIINNYATTIIDNNKIVWNGSPGNYTYLNSFSTQTQLYTFEQIVNENDLRIQLLAIYTQLNSYAKNTILYEIVNSCDIYLAQLDDKFIVLSWDDTGLILNSDYSITSDNRLITFTQNSENTIINMRALSQNELPPTLQIYKLSILDYKDFDFNHINTYFTNYEYARPNTVYESNEQKMYMYDWKSTNEPIPYLEQANGFLGITDIFYDVKNTQIPISSEYTINNETFTIDERGLTHIWDINQSVVKWGYQNSISHWNYPYRLNCSIEAGSYNMEPYLDDSDYDWNKKSINYCLYNWPQDLDLKLCTKSSMHIWQDWGIDKKIKIGSALDKLDPKLNSNIFDADKFLNSTPDNDYFELFFNSVSYSSKNPDSNLNIEVLIEKELICKYAIINNNSVVYRGIKWEINDIEHINNIDNEINEIVISNVTNYDGYKFAVLLSFTNDIVNYKLGNLNTSTGEDTRQWRALLKVLINHDIQSIVLHICIPVGHYWDGTNILTFSNNINYNKTSQKLSDILKYKSTKYAGQIDFALYNWPNEKITVYNDKVISPDLYNLSASNIFNKIQNFFTKDSQNYIETTYTISKNGNITTYTYDNFWSDGIENWKLPIIIIPVDIDAFTVYSKYFTINQVNLGTVELNKNNYYSTNITETAPIIKNINYLTSNEIISSTYSEKQIPDSFTLESYDNPESALLYRYSGPYAPIFNTIQLFKKSQNTKLYPDSNNQYILNFNFNLNPNQNYKFDTSLSEFGKIKDQIIQKINPDGSILTSRDSKQIIALMPRIDEWGLDWVDEFIFKSPWDISFYWKHQKIS